MGDSGWYEHWKETRRKAAEESAQRLGPLPPKYKVLQQDLLRPQDRERAAAITSFVRSNEDAAKLAGHDGYSYRDLDIRGRVGVVCYNGVEVALLFKRIVEHIDIGPGDPVPERLLKEPADAWIQVSLIGAEASTAEKGVSDRLRRAIEQADNYKALYEAEKLDRRTVETKLDDLEAEITELAELKLKIQQYENGLQLASKEVMRLTREVREEKDGRKDDRIKTVTELFPVFNTVWLAGQYRVGDQLYDILHKQLIEALAKVGITLIEPKVGDDFDPRVHHAVHMQEAPQLVDKVIKVERVGWQLGAQVVDAALVVVGTEPREVVNEPSPTVDEGPGDGEAVPQVGGAGEGVLPN